MRRRSAPANGWSDGTWRFFAKGRARQTDLRLTGRTRSNKIVVFEGRENDIGQLIDLKITHSTGFSLSAVKAEAASSCHLSPMEELLPPVVTAS